MASRIQGKEGTLAEWPPLRAWRTVECRSESRQDIGKSLTVRVICRGGTSRMSPSAGINRHTNRHTAHTPEPLVRNTRVSAISTVFSTHPAGLA